MPLGRLVDGFWEELAGLKQMIKKGWTKCGMGKIHEAEFQAKALSDALPSPGVNPLEGSPKCNCGKRDSEGHSRLPTLERGRGSSWEPRD